MSYIGHGLKLFAEFRMLTGEQRNRKEASQAIARDGLNDCQGNFPQCAKCIAPFHLTGYTDVAPDEILRDAVLEARSFQGKSGFVL